MFLNLVPVSAQKENIRNLFPHMWETIRQHAYKKTNYRCAICGGQGTKHPVEAHEEWAYGQGNVVLIDVVPLCPSCHKIKHINFIREARRPDAMINFDRAVRYYMRIFNRYFIKDYTQRITLTQAYERIYSEIDDASRHEHYNYKIDKGSVERYYQSII